MANGGDVIFETHDGSHSILSQKHGVSYHSKYGAIQETQHVFIDHGLKSIASNKKEISILEFGFGTGLNAFMTILWLHKQNKSAYYETIEAYPISLEQAKTLNYSVQLKAKEFHPAFLQMHQAQSNQTLNIAEFFTFKKQIARFQEVQLQAKFDIVYFDAFAPSAQPELWEEHMLAKVYEALLPGGFMTTYCAKGSVKRTLKSLGFKISSPPGPPGKREMTIAKKVDPNKLNSD